MKLLMFKAEWCGPCKEVSRIMNTKSLNVEVETIDIDDDMDSVMKYKIRGVPTAIMVDDTGAETNRAVGILPIKELISRLQ